MSTKTKTESPAAVGLGLRVGVELVHRPVQNTDEGTASLRGRRAHRWTPLHSRFRNQ